MKNIQEDLNQCQEMMMVIPDYNQVISILINISQILIKIEEQCKPQEIL